MSLSVEWFGESSNCVAATLDRPAKRNAVDMALLAALLDLQDEVVRRRCRVLMVCGAGSAFCSGADLDGVELGDFTDTLARTLRGLVNLPCITLAVIDGPALGAGMQLAAACDLRLASPESPIGVPATKLGLAVDAWTVERIGRQAGWSVAQFVLLTGEPVLARSLDGGFVHQLADSERIQDEGRRWAEQLARLAPLSVQAHKLALAEGSTESAEKARLAAWASMDAQEGRAAFRQKREPRFTGR